MLGRQPTLEETKEALKLFNKNCLHLLYENTILDGRESGRQRDKRHSKTTKAGKYYEKQRDKENTESSQTT